MVKGWTVMLSAGEFFRPRRAPPEEPDEALIDPQTAKLLDEVAVRAEAGDIAWLKQHGKVFELVEA